MFVYNVCLHCLFTFTQLFVYFLGPDLPFVISDHTMIQIDSKTIYIIGGHQNGKVSNKTWIADPTNDFQIKEGTVYRPENF